MYEDERNQQADDVENFLAELFERGGTEDDVFQLMMDRAEFNGELPIQWVFKHQPTGETLYFLVDSEDPLSTMGVRISGPDSSSLDFQQQVVFKVLWVNERQGSLEKVSSLNLKSLMRLPEGNRRGKLKSLFDEADRAIREKVGFQE